VITLGYFQFHRPLAVLAPAMPRCSMLLPAASVLRLSGRTIRCSPLYRSTGLAIPRVNLDKS